MKRLGIALAAVAALIVAGHSAAWAADAKAPTITQKQRDQGKAEAPALIANAKITCTPADAYFIQAGTDDKTKVKTSLYEVACAEGPGYLIQDVSAGKDTPEKTSAFDCVAIDAQAGTNKNAARCLLPANLDPNQGFAKLVAASGQPCPSATGARPMGATGAGDTFTEVACTGDVGYVVQLSPGKPPQISDCLQTLGGGATECQLTSKDKILASMTALAAKSGQPCTVSNAREVGRDTTSGMIYYEVACGASPGFIIQANAKKEFQSAIPCDKAQNIGGGCSMTVVDETAEAGTYTKLAQSANFPCDVSKYRYIGKDNKNDEIVELACKNRPDGGIGVFPIGAGKGQVLDCLQGGALGVTCQLTPTSVLYQKYTDRLAAQGKTQCKVSGARYLASTTEGADFIETACSDGLPGFVVSVDHTTGATKELLTCGQASRSGAACTLPTNVGKK